jgi:hypothetical protein
MSLFIAKSHLFFNEKSAAFRHAGLEGSRLPILFSQARHRPRPVCTAERAGGVLPMQCKNYHSVGSGGATEKV